MSYLLTPTTKDHTHPQHLDPRCKNCSKYVKKNVDGDGDNPSTPTKPDPHNNNNTTSSPPNCEEHIGRVMTQLVGSLEKNPAKASHEVNELLRPLTDPQHRAWVAGWRDSLKLNIVHYSIIYKRPKILSFFIAETDDLFPPSSTPLVSPYAHLAAYIGCKECLEIILDNRPRDFFRCSRNIQKHTMVFPPKVRLEARHVEQVKRIEELIQNAEKLTSFRDGHFGFLDRITYSELSFLIEDIDKADLKVIFRSDDSQTFTKLKKPRGSEVGDGYGAFGAAGKESKPTLKLPAITIHTPSSPARKSSIASRSTTSSRRSISSRHSDKSSSRQFPEMERVLKHSPSHPMGVRSNKPLKQFHLNLPRRSTQESTQYAAPSSISSADLQGKTPLTLAAERANIDCVRLILGKVFIKQHQSHPRDFKTPLTLAAKAKSPEAIIAILDSDKVKVSVSDYNMAMRNIIREANTECLAAILTTESKTRERYSDYNENLFHMLYTQSWEPEDEACRRRLSKMTSVLINKGENVNAFSSTRCTYPLYTLVHCCFYVKPEKCLVFYLECFALLLSAKANSNFNEQQMCASSTKTKNTEMRLSRKPYLSAFHCIFENAFETKDYFEKRPDWSRRCMKTLIIKLMMYDKSRRSVHVLNNVLFRYMKYVCDLGLDYTVLKYLLRYGANPDAQNNEGKYVVNVYFENLFPYLTVYQKPNYEAHYLQELDHLMIICRRMSHENLRDALKIFLDSHMSNTPLQAVHIFRYFVYLVNTILKSPPSLADMAALAVWKRCASNVAKVKELPVNERVKLQIIP